MVRGSQVALKHVIHDMETGMELRQCTIKRWVPCGDMDRRLKIPHSAKVECGFRTTPEECLYDSGLIGHQYIGPHNTIQYNTIQYHTRPEQNVPCNYVIYKLIWHCRYDNRVRSHYL